MSIEFILRHEYAYRILNLNFQSAFFIDDQSQTSPSFNYTWYERISRSRFFYRGTTRSWLNQFSNWPFSSLFFFITSKFITYFKYGFIDTPLWSARLVYLRVARSYETKVEGADCARNRRGGSDIWRGEPVSSLGGTGASEIETRREIISFFPLSFRFSLNASRGYVSGIEILVGTISGSHDPRKNQIYTDDRLSHIDRPVSTVIFLVDLIGNLYTAFARFPRFWPIKGASVEKTR